MKHDFKIRLFMGKGGVGKTTIASAYALKNASENKKTLIVSLDPAHNLGDVLGVELGDKPTKITRNLVAIEVNYDKMVEKHLKTLTEKIKDIYGYLRIFNLEKYIDVLSHSPGIEEQAALEKIIEIIKEYGMEKKFDVIVFDTPPTGLTLRIMALPTISIIWIDKLIELRLAILEKRKIIAKTIGEQQEITIAGKKMKIPVEVSEDPIYQELVGLKKEYEFINNILTDPSTTNIVMIVNPETLTILEAKRAYDFLKRIKINTKYIAINKVLAIKELPDELKPRLEQEEKAIKEAEKIFKDTTIVKIPYQPKEPRGLKDLEKLLIYIKNID
ncbi:ArsA family ATPase [Desulfurococcaceae archaeon MEX13E-LK6-19]|nr:ArsA family ATPase [Desulfurococcaceae archaeon MEX13E-LK6-19]